MVETWTSWYPDYALTMYVVCKLILLLLFDYDKLDSIHFIWLWQAGFHSFFSDYGQLDSTPLVWLASWVPLLLSDYDKQDSTPFVWLWQAGFYFFGSTARTGNYTNCCRERMLYWEQTSINQHRTGTVICRVLTEIVRISKLLFIWFLCN